MKDSPEAGTLKTEDMVIKVMKKLFGELSLSDNVEYSSMRKAVHEVLKKVLRDRNIMLNLTKVRSYDSYAFDHSVNVCMLSLMLGLYLKLSRGELYTLGICALLHDIGMDKVDKDVVFKSGALTPEEVAGVHKHPYFGYETLVDMPDIPEEAALVAWQHHERMNGTGYPRGLKGDEIHKFTQIISVADVFDALLADRPFRNAFYPHQAINILVSSKGEFSEDILSVLMEKVLIYPIGCKVKLNSGQRGTVVDTNKDHTRPVIQMEAAEDNSSAYYNEVDLSKQTHLFIVQVLRSK